ncbi:MAG: hypothetical protein GY757_37955, partial [bacterium]|nr:hypothetical protein [bacterium]
MTERNYTEKQAIAADQRQKEQQYWLNKLSGEIEKTRIPSERPEGQKNRYKPGERTFELEPAVYTRLQQMSGGK